MPVTGNGSVVLGLPVVLALPVVLGLAVLRICSLLPVAKRSMGLCLQVVQHGS
jgi:hypothetical protein